MNDATERDFSDLADTLLTLVNAPRTVGTTACVVSALRESYRSGLLAGVELAATGMMLASMLDAEDAQKGAQRADGPVYAGPSVDLHDHPSPREAMAAAGWVGRDPISR
jgi:hypothetical protein